MILHEKKDVPMTQNTGLEFFDDPKEPVMTICIGMGENSIILDCSTIVSEYSEGKSTYLEKELNKLSYREKYDALVSFHAGNNGEDIFIDEMNDRESIENNLIFTITNKALVNDYKIQLERMKKLRELKRLNNYQYFQKSNRRTRKCGKRR